MKKQNLIRMSVVLLAASLAVEFARPAPQEAKANAASALTDAQKEEFLRKAEIVKIKGVSVGITGTQRATLTDGEVTHDASVQTVDIYKPTYPTAHGMEVNFKDSYKYNIAAYRLDRLIDLDMVPVSVERKVGRENASVTWWVDDMQMMEKERYQEKIQPPNRILWNDQMYQARVFIQLTYNTDPNLGNFLITDDWDLWLIDFSRAFRLHKKLRNPDSLVSIDRRVYEGLKRLDESSLMSELQPYLSKAETKAILPRRDRLLEYFDSKIASLGEGAVICNRPGH